MPHLAHWENHKLYQVYTTADPCYSPNLTPQSLPHKIKTQYPQQENTPTLCIGTSKGQGKKNFKKKPERKITQDQAQIPRTQQINKSHPASRKWISTITTKITTITKLINKNIIQNKQTYAEMKAEMWKQKERKPESIPGEVG